MTAIRAQPWEASPRADWLKESVGFTSRPESQVMRHHAPHAGRVGSERFMGARLEPEALQQVARDLPAVVGARAHVRERLEVVRTDKKSRP